MARKYPLGVFLDARIDQLELSESEFAKRAALSVSYVNLLRNNKRKDVTFLKAIKIARAAEITLVELARIAEGVVPPR